MSLLDSSDLRPVHFVGIAGAGMSGLAELLVRRGMRVTGCDASPTEESRRDLARIGVDAIPGHNPEHVLGARMLVVTSAMPRNHPELEAARAAGIPIVRRAEALGEATRVGDVIAIAGTHGKTTTTVLTTEALAAARLDPTGLVGGRVSDWSGNLRPGSDRLFVVEADEYDRSFLALTPTIAVVTNVEADHLDIYRDLADIQSAFEQFIVPARAVVLCADDAGADKLKVTSGAEVVRYGVENNDARVVAESVQLSPSGAVFALYYDGKCLGDVDLQITGMHNVRNALAAIASGLTLGVTLPAMLPGLRRFAGVERRFQRLGEARGVQVVDDYAHHPTEIRATLAAARNAFPRSRLIAAFQPHLYTRTRDFAREFGEALAAADRVYLTEIYPAREQPIAGVTSALVKEAIERAGGTIAWFGERASLADALAGGTDEGDVVLMLGAGDITKTGPELLERLRRGDA
ncbi:MAG TPA: UDP-N-acetylmuramate--L-alanine ligase [Gemmatimonadaceae bacterium]|nr:UDP-N-acetylmuramate--L-alanine ligase [Gemmatimonadaceae bacterium]